MNHKDLITDSMAAIAEQSEAADAIISILVEEPEYLAKHPTLGIAVFRYMAKRNASVEMAKRLIQEQDNES